MSVVHTWKLPDFITALATSPDGRRIVTGCTDGCVRVYDCVAPPYELVCATSTEETRESIVGLAVCAGDECDFWVVTAHDRWMVRCWRVARQLIRLQWTGDGAREGRKKGAWCKATSTCISHNRQWVAVAGENRDGDDSCNADHDICLFLLRTNDDDASLLRPIRVFARHASTRCSLCFLPDDRSLVSSGDDHTLRVWSVESGEQLYRVFSSSSIMSMAVHRRAKRLVTGHWDGSLQSYSLTFVDNQCVVDDESARKECRISHGGPVVALYCAEDDVYAITGGGVKDNIIRIWNLENGNLVQTLAGHTSSIYAVGGVTSTGDIVSCSSNSTVKLWRLDDPDLRRALTPARTLLEEEQRVTQFALDCVTADVEEWKEQPPLAVLVMAGVVLEDTRLRRRIYDAIVAIRRV